MKQSDYVKEHPSKQDPRQRRLCVSTDHTPNRKPVTIMHLCIVCFMSIFLLLTGFPRLPLDEFNNSVDPETEGYQGYHTVADPDEITPVNTCEGEIYITPKLIDLKVSGATAYKLQIALTEYFSDGTTFYTSDEVETN